MDIRGNWFEPTRLVYVQHSVRLDLEAEECDRRCPEYENEEEQSFGLFT